KSTGMNYHSTLITLNRKKTSGNFWTILQRQKAFPETIKRCFSFLFHFFFMSFLFGYSFVHYLLIEFLNYLQKWSAVTASDFRRWNIKANALLQTYNHSMFRMLCSVYPGTGD